MTKAHRSCSVVVENETVAKVLLRYFRLEGVDHLFGIPGGGIANLLTELKDQRNEFKYVVCRQETGAAYIADGYYRITGKLGVVMVTTGPGATNALTGAMNAQAAGSAVMVISGEVNEQFYGMGYLQEGIDVGLNVSSIYRAATQYSSVISSPDNFQTLVSQGLRDALSIPRRAVHLSMPNNVCAENISSINMPATVENYRATPRGVDADQVDQVLRELLRAERPLLFLGNGCREVLKGHRLQKLKRFVERHAIPIVTTADAKGIFPETHEMSLRVYGFANCMWPQYWMVPSRLDPTAPAKFDALLVLGSSLNDLATNKWLDMLIPDGPFMQIDLNQAVIARAFHVDVGVVGEVGAFVDELCKKGDDHAVDDAGAHRRRKTIARIKSEHSPFSDPAQYESEASPIQPAALMRVLQETLPHDVAIFLDAGNCVGWGNHCLVIDPPKQIFSSLAMGPMGFGVGAVIGGALGAPGRTCVAIVGDGAFMMHGAEISTATAYGVGPIWVVLKDDDLHMVSQGQAHFFPDRANPDIWFELYRLGNANLAEFARGLGAEAHEIDSPDQLRAIMPAVLAGSRANKPQVIVAKINFEAAPPYYIADYSPPPPPPHALSASAAPATPHRISRNIK